MHLSAVEIFWLGVNLVTLALTSLAWEDARRNRDAVRLLNGKAREIAAGGDVRRETFRVVVQLLFLLMLVTSGAVTSNRESGLSPFLLNLLAIPVVLCAASFLDALERRELDAVLRT